MRQWILNMFSDSGAQYPFALLSHLLSVAAIVAASLVLWLLLRGVITWIIGAVVRRTKFQWDDIFFKNKVFHRASVIIVPMAMLSIAEYMPVYGGTLVKLGQISGIFVLVMVLISVIRSVDDIYGTYEVSKTRPIRGLLQVLQVAAYIIGIIAAVAILAGQSPLALLGGIGAMTAVTTLIFKDAILGFVSGIQLTGNDMVRIGDWIEMPKYSANGTVTDLSMTTVKVENFDKTITSIPAYAMISDAFINRREMLESGVRRIKRAIYINASDVRFCDAEMLERFRRMDLLREYIDEKMVELEEYNRLHEVDLSEPVNGRRLTNLGTFRIYVTRYLSKHPGICHEMTYIARQLDPCDMGIPLEIYAFANAAALAEYEPIQADIFDHIYAVASEFGLHIYQRPSAADFRALANTKSAD